MLAGYSVCSAAGGRLLAVCAPRRNFAEGIASLCPCSQGLHLLHRPLPPMCVDGIFLLIAQNYTSGLSTGLEPSRPEPSRSLIPDKVTSFQLTKSLFSDHSSLHLLPQVFLDTDFITVEWGTRGKDIVLAFVFLYPRAKSLSMFLKEGGHYFHLTCVSQSVYVWLKCRLSALNQ